MLMFPDGWVRSGRIVIVNFFQSIGKAKSVFSFHLPATLYLLPGLIFFPRFIGLDGIWTSMPVADFFAFLTALVVLWTYIRKKNKESIA
jgi:Na+-driven multidrug efflux pump